MNAVRAVVLAAGKGTRMKSARPKVMHEVCGRPMLWYTLRALAEAGVDEIVVVTNPELDPLVRELTGYGVDGRTPAVKTTIQQPQLGTGHAVQIALRELDARDGTLVVAYGDMPLVNAATFADVIASVQRDGAALGLTTAIMPLPSNFGRIVRFGDGIAKIVEMKDCSAEQLLIDEMNAAIYGYDETALREVIGELRDDNAQKELYLTDTVELLVARGRRVLPVVASDYRLVLGINDRVEMARGRAILNARFCEAHMRAGVTIVDPATTYLEADVVIGSDTVIAPNTTIERGSVIGAGCAIGPNTRIAASRIGNGVTICESVIVESAVAGGCDIGPFAHLRGGASLHENVHIGNFVEIKRSELHADVKAGHLAYLGDATIGERANIGAGTITCNYDGVRKNRTEIGADAFIGSNSSLVAPVTIGANGLTGAGAVVISDVPAGGRVVGNPAKPLPVKATP
jgi:bifunctional UDP-N-acetylglucosamine pyrophosphorylase/glucosamine-1-phosphate N-acetyltransferase